MSWSQNGSTTDGPTDADDTFFGTDGGDSVDGLSGDDLLLGLGGSDTIEGGSGTDVIRGDDDVESPDGDSGDFLTDSLDGAWIYGGGGDDTIVVEVNGQISPDFFASNASAFGQTGDDSIVATGTIGFTRDGFSDRLGLFADGGSGDDTIVGSENADTFYGQDDNDVLSGNGESDILYGGGGNDLLLGGERDDTILGEDGDDTIVGGDGYDSLIGGAGTNTLDFTDAPGAVAFHLAQNQIFLDGYGDGSWPDELDADGNPIGKVPEYAEGFTVAYGSQFDDDFMAGSEVGDSIFGQDGNDRIFGNGGNDTLEGGFGDDSLVGEEGNDLLIGGDGDDTLLGGDGDDFVLGGEGNDSIIATPGRDTIEGQAGEDIIATGDDDDLVIWRVGDGNDVIDMGDGNDTLQLEGWTGGEDDNWTVASETDGSRNYIYDDGLGATFTLNVRGEETVACFAAGTRILTARGEVPVETLRAGDLVVAPGRGAALKPVRWVGHTRVDIARQRDPRKIAPVLIRAGALGAGTPMRDLRVSPEHAFLLQGRLVPAHLLLNGSTIVQEAWHRAMTYWHVELEEHGVLVAEGALAESYFDEGNRRLFDNGVFALHVDFGAGRAAGRYAREACAPPILDAEDPALPRMRAALPAAAQDSMARRA